MSDEIITDDEFEHLLDELHGDGAGPTSAAAVADAAPATVDDGCITDSEFEDLLDELHGEGCGPTADAANLPCALVLGSSLNIDDIAALADRLREEVQGDEVVVDAAAVETVDSAGLQLLAALVRSTQSRGGQVHWSGVAPPFTEAATTLGLGDMLGIPAQADG